MKVKAILNLGSIDYAEPEYQLKDGQEAELPEAIGLKMIARRHAVAVVEVKADKPESTISKGSK